MFCVLQLSAFVACFYCHPLKQRGLWFFKGEAWGVSLWSAHDIRQHCPTGEDIFKMCCHRQRLQSPPRPAFIELPSFSAELLKNFFSANVLWLKRGSRPADGVFAANKQQDEAAAKGVRG